MRSLDGTLDAAAPVPGPAAPRARKAQAKRSAAFRQKLQPRPEPVAAPPLPGDAFDSHESGAEELAPLQDSVAADLEAVMAEAEQEWQGNWLGCDACQCWKKCLPQGAERFGQAGVPFQCSFIGRTCAGEDDEE